jgi:AraC family transcriptional regulator
VSIRGFLPGAEIRLHYAIQDTFTRVYSEWFPTSGYEHADGAELKVYPEGDMSSADYSCEAWMPVGKVSKG